MNPDFLKKQLLSKYSIKETTWKKVEKLAEGRKLEKMAELIRAGSAFDHEIFLTRGVLRTYVTSSSGKEYTVSFYTQGDFIAPAFSRTAEGKSILNIQALTECELFLFETPEFTRLRYENPDLWMLGTQVLEKEMEKKSRKEILLATASLKELYQFFREEFGPLELQISQYHIASYLGADPVSLSRIRSVK